MTSSECFERLRSPALLAVSNGRILPSQFLCLTAEEIALCGEGVRDVITHLTAAQHD